MQFPTLNTSVFPGGGSAIFSEAQVGLFLEHLRKQTEQSDEAKQREKQELVEQIQRNADKRKSELQQTRLQMIADSRQTQDRRHQLDAIDDRKSLRRQELDRKELDAQLDHRLDQRQRDSENFSAKLLEPLQTSNGEAERLEIEPLHPVGIARQAAMDSEHFTPKSATEVKSVALPTDREPPEPQRNVTVNDFSAQTVEKPLTVERNLAENRNTENRKAENQSKVITKTDPVEAGKPMQTLASFSGIAGKLAAVLRQPNSVNGVAKNLRPGFANLREVSQNSNRHSAEGEPSGEGMKLDTLSPDKRPPKMSSEFLAALDAALRSKSRKKEPQESVKDDFQSQSQQTELQQRTAARKANEKDRPMLDQMERVRLVQRVANACLSASNRNGTIRIKLHPESLGSVAVKIKTKNKTMSIELEAETESAKSVLLENSDDLKRQLQKHGMTVESFFVQVRTGLT